MVRSSKSERVPKQMYGTYEIIASHIDEFCDEYLNAEYAQLGRQMTAALCRKRPSPLVRGRPDVWACGIVYALGSINFLFDKSEEPYMSTAELCKRFGVGQSTGAAKSKAVRELLNVRWMDPDWWLPNMLDHHPTVWLVQVDDIILDARYMRREIQEVLVKEGIIPYIPGERETG